MKTTWTLLAILSGSLAAQGKIGYVDFQYILSQVQSATDVQLELQRLASDWTDEIESMQDSVGILEKELETISLALSQTSRDILVKSIADRKRDVAALREKRFSPVTGDLYKKQQELLQPILDKIKKAIDNVRIRSKYDVLFDISAGNPVSIDKRLDLTLSVIEELPAVGLTVHKQQDGQQQEFESGTQSGSKRKNPRESGTRQPRKEESKDSQVGKEDIDQ